MSSMPQAIKDAVFETIRKPSFDSSLPSLSDATWAKLLGPSAMMERERLEFVGDALFYAALGVALYRQIPNGTPHMYTCLRSVLHSNAVHSRVAEKLDILAVPDVVLRYLSKKDFGEGVSAPASKAKPQVKATADLFETVLGAYSFENGFDSLCGWVGDLYAPLISSAKKAFDRCQLLSNKGKRRRLYADNDAGIRAEDYYAAVAHKKRKLAKEPVPLGSRTNINRAGRGMSLANTHADATASSPRQRALHDAPDVRKVVAPMPVKTASSRHAMTGTVKAKKAISTPAKHRTSPGKKRTPLGTRKTVAQSKAKVIFIDLTLSSDSSDDEAGPAVTRKTRGAASTKVATRAPSVLASKTGSSSRSASRSDEDSQEEAMLERMLIPHASSDMELGSSDLEDGEIAMDLGEDEDEDEDLDDNSDMDLGSDTSYLRVYN